MKDSLHPSATPASNAPTAFVSGGTSARHPQPAPPASSAGEPATGYYVDPYLFETGFFVSRAEEQALTRSSADRVQLREEAEARPKRRPARPRKSA